MKRVDGIGADRNGVQGASAAKAPRQISRPISREESRAVIKAHTTSG